MILDEIHLLGADRGPILEVLNYTLSLLRVHRNLLFY